MEYLNLNPESSIIHEGALHTGSGVFLNCDVHSVCVRCGCSSPSRTLNSREVMMLPHHCFNYCAGRCGWFSNTCCPAQMAVLTLRVRPILLYPILEVKLASGSCTMLLIRLLNRQRRFRFRFPLLEGDDLLEYECA